MCCDNFVVLGHINSLEDNKVRILGNSEFFKAFSECELLHGVKCMDKPKNQNMVSRAYAERTNSLDPEGKSTLGSGKAIKLDMDHVFVKYFDFLWAYTFIGPFSYLLWLRGTSLLRVRKFLHRAGLIKPKVDYDALAATLCLEQTQAIHYYGRLGNIAGFFFADFPYVDNECNMKTVKLFAVDIDLETKRFIKAKFGNENLTAKETCILLLYNTIAVQHVKCEYIL